MKYGCDKVQKVPIGVFVTKLQYVKHLGPNLKNVTLYVAISLVAGVYSLNRKV